MKATRHETDGRVRRIAPADEPDLARVAEIRRAVFGPADGLDGSPQRARGRSDDPAADSRAITLVSEQEGELLGFACGRPAGDDAFEILRLGVLTEARKQGVGGALLTGLEQRARKANFGTLRCTIPNDAKAMMRLCIAHGMQIVGLRRPADEAGIIFEKPVGAPALARPGRRSIAFSVEGWPIKRACELEGIYAEVFGDELDDGHPTLDEMLMIDATYEDVLHVAVADGRPIGFKHAQERTRGGLHSHIGAVHPDFRGGGVAAALMKVQHEWAASQGYAAVTTRSRNRYPHMMRLNLKAGFDIVGVVEAMGELSIHLFKRLR